MASSLYSKHFSLTGAPFPLTPDSDAFFQGGSRKAPARAIVHVLTEDRGIAKVVGDAGTGKTTLCRYLARTLRDRYTVVYTCDPALGDDQTWYALADALGIGVERGQGAAAAAAVRRRVGELHDQGHPVLLLIDEAHALSIETLEQLRLLAQRDTGDETLRMVLLGPDDLDRRLAMPSMDALRTRIAHSVRLKRLNLGDIAEYLHFRMGSAGWTGRQVFQDNAVRAIAKLSGGIPRRVNMLADKALLSAALDRRHEVGGRDVAAAAEDIRGERKGRRGIGWKVGLAGFAGGIAVTAIVLGVALRARQGVPPAPVPAAASATPAAPASGAPAITATEGSSEASAAPPGGGTPTASPPPAPAGPMAPAATVSPAPADAATSSPRQVQAAAAPVPPAPQPAVSVDLEPSLGARTDSLIDSSGLPPPRFVQELRKPGDTQ